MKLYNPFKWHIRRMNGKFVVSKWTLIGWRYADSRDLYSWSTYAGYWTKYCPVNTIQEARAILDRLKENNKYIEG
jgi:hypothetical protein